MTTKKHKLLLGAHMSISGGFYKSIESGASIGCTTIQIFTKSNRQWHANPIDNAAIRDFKKAKDHYQIDPVIAHATYLINLASANKDFEKKSVESLLIELDRTQLLDIPYLVLHPGSSGTLDEQTGIEQIIKNLTYVLQKTKSSTQILLETMAGQGSSLCDTFQELAYIINTIGSDQLGVCFDTCHAFVAGYDFATPASYKKMWQSFDDIIGLEKLKVIHVNDSKKELGSHVDRHEHIGQGKIGKEAFELLFNDETFFDIPKILETPKVTKEPFTEDKMNIATIHSLLNPATKNKLSV